MICLQQLDKLLVCGSMRNITEAGQLSISTTQLMISIYLITYLSDYLSV